MKHLLTPTKKKLITDAHNKKFITSPQKTAMMAHGEHHTVKHLRMMIKLMKEGKTFKQSHTETQLKVGK